MLSSPGRADNEMLTQPCAGQNPANPNCVGQNLTPALAWTRVPAGTQSLAIVMDDQAGRAGLGVNQSRLVRGSPVSRKARHRFDANAVARCGVTAPAFRRRMSASGHPVVGCWRPLRVEMTHQRSAASGHRTFNVSFQAMNAKGRSSQPDPIPSSALLQSRPTLGPTSCGLRRREAAVGGTRARPRGDLDDALDIHPVAIQRKAGFRRRA